MSTNAARSWAAIKKHVPMIKFRKVEHSVANNTDNAVIPLVVTIKEKPSPASSSSIEYSQLPAKYRRMPISQTEIEFINRGGPF